MLSQVSNLAARRSVSSAVTLTVLKKEILQGMLCHKVFLNLFPIPTRELIGMKITYQST
jgi:hypothetical protein